MKKIIPILIALLLPMTVAAYVSPGKPTGFVNDFAGVLSATEKQNLEVKLQSLRDATSAEVAVATVVSLGDETIETYATKLFAEWGLGGEKKDTGILILVVPTERQMRIEVGYGLEGPVTDLQADTIMRTVMAPAFREGKYGEGIRGAVDALGAIITGSPEAEKYSKPATSSSGINMEWGLFLLVILFNVFGRLLGATKSWWLGGVIGAIIGTIIAFFVGFVYTGIVWIIVLTVLGLIFDYFVSKHPPGSGHDGGFWPMFFGGGGGGHGGFGGFGGGMSGGGGASGRW